MKLTTVLILAACVHVSATGHGQSITLSQKDATLEQVFTEIKKQSGYTFFYADNLLSNAKKVTVSVKNADIEQVLDIVFKDQPLTYTIIDKADKFVVVKPTAVLQSNVPTPLTTDNSPLTIDISGKVTDKDGNPLQGATITVKGNDRLITRTDINGVFVLKGLSENDVIVISYAEYQSQSFKVGSNTSFFVKLETAEKLMGEVIISKGYYTEKQKYSVGNVTHIDSKVFEQSPVTNPLLSLQGRVPGMEITQLTGLPGGGVTVRIQGRNSFANGNEPLVVIDGVPYPTNFEGRLSQEIIQGGSPLNLVNPQNIESVDVLKDADATAIYGSRAANGAILITTKKGKVGRTKVSLDLQQGWGKVGRKLDMMDTRQYLDMRYEAYRNDGIAIGSLTQDGSNYDLTLWDTTRYTDWQKELIGGTAKFTQLNASISGGTQAVQYLVSANYNRQTTVFPGDFDNKAGGMLFSVGGNSANQRLNIQLSGSYSFSNNHLPGFDLTKDAIIMAPTAPSLYKEDGSLNWEPDMSGNSSWQNPLRYAVNADFINTDKGLFSNLTLNYKIISGLTFRTSAGYRNSISDLYRPTRQEYTAPENRVYNIRTASFGNRTMNGWNIEPQLDYSHKISKGQLSALVGTTILKSSYKAFEVEGRGFPTDELMTTLKAATSISVSASSSFVTRFNALYGRLGYIYDKKYLLNLTGRRDGSNKFGEANRFHNFWSAAGGWIFSETKWSRKTLLPLSFGKLSASYGLTGNDQIGEFEYLSRYSIINSNGIPYQSSLALNAQNIPNPHLQWEETRKLSFRLDLGFFNDRINFSANYNRNRSSNQLLSYVLPTLTGFSSISKNLPAVIQNAGMELMLNTVNVQNKNFTWSSSLNLTIPRNARLISFPGIENTPYAKPFIGGATFAVGQP
ncbi:MAG TPA: SusC/RagA family TonB-linked outer membrane protein, partial [Chitinophagaceae bacterium]|nr:SusC/RagA family TonB-linked outer membrane protein [Chitinophagaceae bacterium]